MLPDAGEKLQDHIKLESMTINHINRNIRNLGIALLCLTAVCGCRKGDVIVPSKPTNVTDSVKNASVKGFFLLNEGNMGSNKCTLDYFDYSTGVYSKNIYPERNPNVVKELGDVGNDLQIYGGRLYAVVNCSNLVEVMDVRTARHVGTVSVPNCRYIVFDAGYAYVSSYAGPVLVDPNARLGYVAKIDTATLSVVDTCVVGYQPEEMAISNGKLFVANSGGYRVPNYDRTVSVISLSSFRETRKIDVAINLHRMKLDDYGHIWISSRGNYYGTPSKTYVLDAASESVIDSIPDLPNSGMALSGDSLYVISADWSYDKHVNSVSYAIVNVKSRAVVTRSFISDGTESKIAIPYGIAVNPSTHEIFVSDAGNYVTPGTLYCFDRTGRKKWSVTTGDIPAHFAFTHTALK